jgi:hypothetical protein
LRPALKSGPFCVLRPSPDLNRCATCADPNAGHPIAAVAQPATSVGTARSKGRGFESRLPRTLLPMTAFGAAASGKSGYRATLGFAEAAPTREAERPPLHANGHSARRGKRASFHCRRTSARGAQRPSKPMTAEFDSPRLLHHRRARSPRTRRDPPASPPAARPLFLVRESGSRPASGRSGRGVCLCERCLRETG